MHQTNGLMSLFTSKREQRLWTWTLASVVAIYSTLGLASILAEQLRKKGMNDDIAAVAFLTAMLLVGLTILTQGLKTRPSGREVAVVLGLTAVYFMLFFRMTMPERSHLIEYSVVAVFCYEALLERQKQGALARFPAILAIFITTLLGAIDECIQYFLPNRVFAFEDIVFNTFAAILAVVASTILAWAQHRLGKRSSKT